jgi:hypothetical protein
MITESKKTISVPVPVTVETKYQNKQVNVYTCSDGKVYSSADDRQGYLTAKELAEQYEKNLDIVELGKKEIRFFPIQNDKFDNEGYERQFCFYLRHDLSENAKHTILKLVHEIDYVQDIAKMPEGWYLVDQTVFEIESSGRSRQYECNGHVTLMEEYLKKKEDSLNNYKKIFRQLFVSNVHDKANHDYNICRACFREPDCKIKPENDNNCAEFLANK